ncbi:MAG: glycosyltransferase family 4 protein [Deltaproteobacteria bacterium]|nr:glycosyltransferase family 4 protein [Deltaproteobacteria bacterium]
MRILQVVHEFPPEAWAGTELVTLHLSQALQARGHEVTIFLRVADPAAEELSVCEEQRYGLPIVTVVNNYTKTTSSRLTYDNAFFDDVFVQLLERLQPDVVHFQHVAHLSVNLIPLARALGYPTVLSLHDFYFVCHRIHLVDSQQRLCAGPERGERCVPCLQEHVPAETARHRFPFMEQALQAPDVVLTPSRFLEQRMLEYFPALRSRLRTVPLGVPRPVVPDREAYDASRPLRILYVGVLIPHKGAHVLLEALRGLPTDAFATSFYGMALSGWQWYADRLAELAAGLPVHFRGVYAHEELGPILAQHDVLVMPGICEETFSLMTREALLAGLPVIAARRGALPEAVVDGENGFLFEPENADELRHLLSRLIEQPELCVQLQSQRLSVKTVDEYTDDMEAVYAELCATPRAAATLPQRLVAQQHELLALQRRNEQQQDELRTTAQTLREQEVRLGAIYDSTTWRLYRGYETCVRFLKQTPFRQLRRWLLGTEKKPA